MVMTMTTKTRLKKIEQASGTGEKKKYLCVVNEAGGAFQSEGYKVQSLFGGEDLHFNTRGELDEFEKRPDVELTLIRVISASEDIGGNA